MKTLIALFLTIATASAQNISKVTTIFVESGRTNQFGVMVYGNATNTVYIPPGEAARVSTLQFQGETGTAGFWFVQNGRWWNADQGSVAEGPAWFIIELDTTENLAARMTLERWKVAKETQRPTTR